MDVERYRRVRAVFVEASRLGGTERDAYLGRACGGDADLRAAVDRLLASPTVATGAVLPPADVPVPAACGPYRIEGELGRGGMGVVYAARAPDTGEAVAVKLVLPHHAASPALLERFLREATLGRQVDHRNVVRTLDAGHAGGRPYLVMERVEGRTLRALLRDLGTVPERLVREIAVQAGGGLEAIHAAGIVHRDLKPENILITADQRVRIMDLGIAKLLGAEGELTGVGQFLGSLHYAAPEQCELRDVGPAADLYSLGVVLYELATGTNPFARGGPGAVLKAHLQVRPPPAGEANPDLSPFLGEVIATLLEKEPGRRFASAGEVRAVVAAGEGGPWWTGRVRGLPPRRPRIRVRRDTRLFGRAAHVRSLRDAWEDAREARGAVVVLKGEAGIGKTRLVAEFLDGIAAEGQVLYGSFPPGGRMEGLCDAVLERFAGTPLEDAVRPYLARTPSLAPSFTAFLKGETPARPLPPTALESLFCDLLRGLAAEAPVAWVVDDLHFAPEEARAVARALARAARGQRALLLLTARPGPADAALAALEPLEHARAVALERLGADEVVRLLGAAFGDERLANDLGRKIAAKADGVPFFVFEMVRGLEEQAVLERRAGGGYAQARAVDELEVPSAVRDLVAARLAFLTAEERAVLDAGAVLGFEFDAEPVAAVLRRPLVRVLQELAAVERGHGLVRAADRLYRFDHHQIQEVLYASMAPRLREELHALIAEDRAVKLPGEARGEDAWFLAAHHLRGARPALGLPHLPAALDHLEQRYLNAEALSLMEAALAHPSLLDDAQRLRLLLRRANRLDILARRPEQLAAAQDAEALARRLGEDVLRAEALQVVGKHAWATSRGEEAVGRFEEALRLAEGGDPVREVSIRCSLGSALWHRDRPEDARAQLEAARRLAVAAGDRQGEGTAVGTLGLVMLELARRDEARECFEHCAAAARELGDPRMEGIAEGNLALCLRDEGRFEETLEHWTRTLRLMVETGDRLSEATATGNLGLVCFDLGRLAEAEAHFRRQHDLAGEIDDLYNRMRSTFDRGRARLAAGDLETAENHFLRAGGIAREMNARRLGAHVLVRRAQLAHWRGDAAGAERLAKDALRRFREVSDRRFAANALLFLGQLAAERGDAAADGHFENAARAAAEIGVHGVRVRALAHAATRGRPAADAVAALAEARGRMTLWERMEAYALLHAATGGADHLARARELLHFAVDQAAPEDRAAMVSRVPLHRDIEAAGRASR